MVLINLKTYSPSSYVGSPRFTQMEKTIRTKTSSGEDYPTMEQVGLILFSSFGKKTKSSLLDGDICNTGGSGSSREGLL